MMNELFYCPITGDIMEEPYIDKEGNTYEKNAIYEWLRRDKTSPITRSRLRMTDLTPNRILKEIIDTEKRKEESLSTTSTSKKNQRKLPPPEGSAARLREAVISKNTHDLLVFLTLYDTSTVIDSVDENGITSLIHASSSGHKDIVAYLLANNADVDATTTIKGNTALIEASRCGYLEIVELLIRHECDINKANKFGWTALICAAMHFHEEVVSALLRNHADANAVTNAGCSALLVAAEKGSVDIVAALLQSGAIVNHAAENGENALILASKNKHDLIVELLLESGADVNRCDETGKTALMHAAQYGDLSCVGILLEATRGEQRYVALIYAKVHGHTLIEEFLLSVGAVTQFEKTATLLHACSQGYIDVVKTLIASGDLCINHANQYGYTPLIIACQTGNLPMVDFLLENGANVNCLTYENRTALMYACGGQNHGNFTFEHRTECNTIVERLLAYGAKVNMLDSCGYNALSQATCAGNTEVVHLLLTWGADCRGFRDGMSCSSRGNMARSGMEHIDTNHPWEIFANADYVPTTFAK